MSNRVRKSIGSETTMAEDILALERIHDILRQLAGSVASSLEKHNSGGYTLTLKVRYHDFLTVTRSASFKTPLFTTADILSCLPRLLHDTQAGRRKVRLLGVTVSGLITRSGTPYQLRLPFPLGRDSSFSSTGTDQQHFSGVYVTKIEPII